MTTVEAPRTIADAILNTLKAQGAIKLNDMKAAVEELMGGEVSIEGVNKSLRTLIDAGKAVRADRGIYVSTDPEIGVDLAAKAEAFILQFLTPVKAVGSVGGKKKHYWQWCAQTAGHITAAYVEQHRKHIPKSVFEAAALALMARGLVDVAPKMIGAPFDLDYYEITKAGWELAEALA